MSVKGSMLFDVVILSIIISASIILTIYILNYNCQKHNNYNETDDSCTWCYTYNLNCKCVNYKLVSYSVNHSECYIGSIQFKGVFIKEYVIK